MSVHILDTWEIAQMVQSEMDKIHSTQRRIGMILYPHRDNTELLNSLEHEYGNLAYIKRCMEIYRSSLIVDI